MSVFQCAEPDPPVRVEPGMDPHPPAPLDQPFEASAVDGEVVVMAVGGPPAFSMTPKAAHVTAARIETAATEAERVFAR